MPHMEFTHDLARAIEARARELEARAARWRALIGLLAAPAPDAEPNEGDDSEEPPVGPQRGF